MSSHSKTTHDIIWPEGKRFAFTVFDDTDRMTVNNGRPVYDFLAEMGFRTTKSVWPISGRGPTCVSAGSTCRDPDHAQWVRALQEQGFEIGLHSAAPTTSTREEWVVAIEHFKDLFGAYPATYANHAGCVDSIYWGDQRVSGTHRLAYNLLTRFKKCHFQGHRPGSPQFWGDICRRHIRYVRNFVYPDINTLKQCPQMPYHDPQRPFVNAWYASSEGPSLEAFNQTISEANQERLEEEGGLCIMYTHFGFGFVEDRRLDSRFMSLMRRLSSRPGWFVPVSEVLDHVKAVRGGLHVITATERRALERRWLAHKIRRGGTT